MSGILERVNSVADIKALTPPELEQLAAEIRGYMLEVVSQNGGHLAPNLGVVELTIALNRVYDFPQDKIIWDVGHQSYAYKILTGRREAFRTIRTFGGLSGFPNPAESEYDSFHAGHSSTSISVAMGLATARDLKGEKHQVVAVIGDGALTSGLAYEAMNHVGATQTPLTVVLNDNEMSIANNVGAISQYLARLRTHPRYKMAKQRAYNVMGRVPLGKGIEKFFNRAKDSVKYFMMTNMLFEELGFVYLGPIDGHDINMMTKMLNRARQMERPVMLHVLTQKGKGYVPAEENPQRFHGIVAFDPATGQPNGKSGRPTYTQVFSQAMLKAAAKYPNLVAISAAMADGVGLLPFAGSYPQRFFDVGIAEPHAVTFAAGLAKGGMKPVVAIYSTFLQRAFDQIVHDVCLPGLPVVFAIDRAGLVGEDGATHHGMFDLSYLRSIPNLRILAPADGAELEQMLDYALEQTQPVAIRYPRGKAPVLALPRQPLADGRAEMLRQGQDVLLAACGSMVEIALTTAEVLARQGIRAAVLNARFVAPLDDNSLRQEAARCGRLVTLEENAASGGFGSACLESLAETPVPTLRIALPDRFLTHGATEILHQEYGLTVEQIAGRIMNQWFRKE